MCRHIQRRYGRQASRRGREFLAEEMSHRVNNLLAIASGLTPITSRSTKTVEDMAHELTLRLTALGRAHDLVRPVPGHTAGRRSTPKRRLELAGHVVLGCLGRGNHGAHAEELVCHAGVFLKVDRVACGSHLVGETQAVVVKGIDLG